MSKNKINDIIDIDLEDLRNIKMDNKPYEQMFKDLLQVDGFKQYLQETMALDIKRKWYASPASHERIHGHFDFAKYILSILEHFAEVKTEEALDKEE